MKELMPIGSIYKAGDNKAMVLGYTQNQKDNRFIVSYIMCGYPQGFTSIDDVWIVPVDADMELIFNGLRNDQFDKFITNRQQLYELSDTMSISEWNQRLREMENAIIKASGEE